MKNKINYYTETMAYMNVVFRIVRFSHGRASALAHKAKLYNKIM